MWQDYKLVDQRDDITMIDATATFKSFLENLKTESNKVFVESITEGFTICFEDESNPANPNEETGDNLQTSEQTAQALEQTKKEEEVLTKLNTEQKDVENVKAELTELNKDDVNKPVEPTAVA